MNDSIFNRLTPAAQGEYKALDRMVEKHNAARLHLLSVKAGIDARLDEMNRDAVEIYSCWQMDKNLVEAFDCRIQFDGTLKLAPWDN
jgi:hypothetical protein